MLDGNSSRVNLTSSIWTLALCTGLKISCFLSCFYYYYAPPLSSVSIGVSRALKIEGGGLHLGFRVYFVQWRRVWSVALMHPIVNFNVLRS